jgi:translation initiation factor IF-2
MRINVLDRSRLVCELVCLEPDQQEKRKANSVSDEMYVVLEGKARIRTEAQIEELDLQDAVVIPPEVEATISNPGPERLTLLSMVAPKPARAGEVRLPSESGWRDERPARGGDRPPPRDRAGPPRFRDGPPRPWTPRGREGAPAGGPPRYRSNGPPGSRPPGPRDGAPSDGPGGRGRYEQTRSAPLSRGPSGPPRPRPPRGSVMGAGTPIRARPGGPPREGAPPRGAVSGGYGGGRPTGPGGAPRGGRGRPGFNGPPASGPGRGSRPPANRGEGGPPRGPRDASRPPRGDQRGRPGSDRSGPRTSGRR